MAVNLSDFTFTNVDDVFVLEPGQAIVNRGSIDFLGGDDVVQGFDVAFGIQNKGRIVLGQGENELTGIGSVGLRNFASGSILGGDDADTVGGVSVMNEGFISLGDGDDTLFSSTPLGRALAGIAPSFGFVNLGTLSAGAGDDVIFAGTLGARNSGAILMGRGNDRFDMLVTDEIGLDNSGYIETGSGAGVADQDVISVSGLSQIGLRNTGTIQTGGDADRIQVEAAMEGRDTIGVRNVGTISMGTGDDELSGAGSGRGVQNEQTLFFGAGNDKLLGRSSIPNVFGGGELGAVSLFNEVSATIEMGAGDDQVQGIEGDDGVLNKGSLQLGEGNDLLEGSGRISGVINSGFLDLGNGSDRLLAFGPRGGGLSNSGTLLTGEGDDFLSGVGGFVGVDNDQYLSMGNGNDRLLGVGNGSGVNNRGLIQMGAGDDVVHGTGGFSGFEGGGTIDLGRGDDRLYGWGNQVIQGGAGYDIVFLDGSFDAALNRSSDSLAFADVTLSQGSASGRWTLKADVGVTSPTATDTNMTLLGVEEVRFADQTVLL